MRCDVAGLAADQDVQARHRATADGRRERTGWRSPHVGPAETGPDWAMRRGEFGGLPPHLVVTDQYSCPTPEIRCGRPHGAVVVGL